MTPQFLQEVVNHYCYPHQDYVVVGLGVRRFFILHPVSNILFHSYSRQHRYSSDQFELWRGERFYCTFGVI